MTDKKVATYICGGCGLGDRLDLDQLVNIADGENKSDIVRKHEFLCNSKGVSLIRKDIDEDQVTHVVIAACSRRAKTEAFDFEDAAIARANLREGVIWVRPDSEDMQETTQDMADDYLRMAGAEIRYMEKPAANESLDSNKSILVVGGGMSGLTAAVEAARAGYKIFVVEKQGRLGGWAARLWRRIPTREPFSDPEDTGLAGLIERAEKESNIEIFLNSTISRTSGAPGRFSIDISQESGSTRTENVGAIVQASGFQSYAAEHLSEFAYSKSADVIDQAELEQIALAADGGPIKRSSDGREIGSVVFIQCAGQRSDKEEHLSYCSGFCCNTSIKQAMYFKDNNPDVDTNIIYTDLRTPGNGEDFYRSAQRKGVTFTKGTVSSVSPGTDHLEVGFFDLILNEEVICHTDLVVLATGQVPNSGVNIEQEDEGQNEDKVDGKDAGGEDTGEVVEIPVESILNLTYRQGPDLPQLWHGFSDSHFICFPYETQRTGIYACGPARRPMDIAQATEDATGAAMKAIQAVENSALGRAAHPRSGDLSFPTFRKEGCTQCKRCTVECPFGAIDEDEESYPIFNEGRCRRCGTCMGACPVRVISFENFSVDTVGQQIKAVDMPDEFDEKPRILILACENDAYPALDMAAQQRREYNQFVRVVPVRCLGSVNTVWVTDALNAGYDGVMLMGCKKGENYQCHFVKGSELAHYRMGKIGDSLQQLQLETERVQTFEVEITDTDRVAELINEYSRQIDEIGMNPFKGF
ncbi:FAD-dependent oxidoreductase [Gammaproteobacteria bacterium]|nr:FAD-dependent oxidoreductase [Gammaproteobacteria bacterium]